MNGLEADDMKQQENRTEEEAEKNTIEQGQDEKQEQARKKDKPEKEKKKGGGIVREIVIYAVIVFLCIMVVPRYVIQRTEVDGRSMMDTLQDEENLLVEKITYRFKDPERFDIITFYPRGDKSEYYIKRIIGLPGENIRIDGDTIYIDGEVLEEDFGREPMAIDPGKAGTQEGVTLGDDEYYVLGDNRNESSDSRDDDESEPTHVGVVKRSYIDGHAILRIYPFSKFGTLRETVGETE